MWNIVKMALEVCQKRQEESMKNSHTVLAMVLMEGIILRIVHGGCNPMEETEGPCSMIAVLVDCVLY